MFATDENGWAIGAIDALPPAAAYSLLSPEPGSRLDGARWAHQARTFFSSTLTLVSEKRYPGGASPLADTFVVDLAPLREGAFVPTRLTGRTLPFDRAPEVREASKQGIAAIGDAGFDVLLRRAQRLFQVSTEVPPEGDPRTPLLLAAILASVLLAPIVPPDARAAFGVKGARERLEKLGLRC
jgi:hypothetical protein